MKRTDRRIDGLVRGLIGRSRPMGVRDNAFVRGYEEGREVRASLEADTAILIDHIGKPTEPDPTFPLPEDTPADAARLAEEQGLDPAADDDAGV